MSRRVEKLIASAGGIGYLPLAPGTWAAIIALITWYFLHHVFVFSPALQLLLVLSALVLGLWSSIRLEGEWGKDPSQIVMDEWVGMWITCLFLPASLEILLIALVVFRILDIWKPLFIRSAEKLKGGIGVMMDDVLAGILGNLLIHFFIWIVYK
ncbi:MAG TPA: phosphatidylglycerophosphatase A [Bacteroidia bacterium]|nr:phosphatidylglycerophosphatase A [Bacteroidia bacterium]HNS11574.1 phosphatidylglycerophosphatase A [Bacteroidia bacterium]